MSVSVLFFLSRLWGHVWRIQLDSFQRVDCYLAANVAISKRITVFVLFYVMHDRIHKPTVMHAM